MLRGRLRFLEFLKEENMARDLSCPANCAHKVNRKDQVHLLDYAFVHVYGGDVLYYPHKSSILAVLKAPSSHLANKYL